MDEQISDLLNRLKSNKSGSDIETPSNTKGTLKEGKLGNLMDDIENEFAELDELLNEVNLGKK